MKMANKEQDKYRYIIYRIVDNKQIEIEKIGSREESY